MSPETKLQLIKQASETYDKGFLLSKYFTKENFIATTVEISGIAGLFLLNNIKPTDAIVKFEELITEKFNHLDEKLKGILIGMHSGTYLSAYSQQQLREQFFEEFKELNSDNKSTNIN